MRLIELIFGLREVSQLCCELLLEAIAPAK